MGSPPSSTDGSEVDAALPLAGTRERRSGTADRRDEFHSATDPHVWDASPVGPFHPDRSAFAHAGGPDAPEVRRMSKFNRAGPLLVMGPGDPSLRAERILQGLRGTNVTIAYQDLDLVYSWIANPPAGFENAVGVRDADILPPAIAEMLTREKQRCLRSGEGAEITLDISEGAPRWFDIWLEPDFARAQDGDPTVEGIVVVGIEVTERVEREARLKVLLREVSHRSRNLLAIVQSIASQTVRGVAAQTPRFLDRFNERLQSLAHTLDLVTLREWEGATLHQLVSRQAAPFRPHAGSIEIGGPDPVLTPNAALHLGLGVQELASNALKHGAWSAQAGSAQEGAEHEGRVEARTRMEEDGVLLFEWIEHSSDGRCLESTGSFGSRTLMAVVPAALNGEATMVTRSDGFSYRLRMPRANFDA